MGNMDESIPSLIKITVCVAKVVDQFFTPWYVRLWRTIKRKLY